MYKGVFSFVLCLLLVSGKAQRLNNTVYSFAEGMPQSQVTFIDQDNLGRLWLGTRGGGLAIFDGVNFENITGRDGLKSPEPRAFFQENDSTIWLGTTHGMNLFVNGEIQPDRPKLAALQKQYHNDICQGDDGEIYVATARGAYVFKSDSLYQLGPKLNCRDLCEHDGNWYVGAKEGLFLVKADSLVQLTTTYVATLTSMNGELYVGSRDGLFVYLESMIQVHEDILQGAAVRALYKDGKDRLWIGTKGKGVFQITNGKMRSYSPETGLENMQINCFYEDRELNLWIGLDGDGILKVDQGKFVSLSNDKYDLMNTPIFGLHATATELWIGNREAVFYIDSLGSHKIDLGIHDGNVTDINEFEGDIVLSNMNMGIQFIRDGKLIKILTEKDGLISTKVRGFVPYSDDSLLIFTLIGAQFYSGGVLHPKVEFNPEIKNNRFISGVTAKDGTLWMADSKKGVIRLNRDGSFHEYGKKEGLSSSIIIDVEEDEHGHIWAASYDGLSVIDPETDEVTTIFEKDGLSSNLLFSLATNKEGDMMIGTSHGVNKVHMDLYHEHDSVVISSYGILEGFNGYECNVGGIAKTTEGDVWFGTMKGVYKYLAENDYVNTCEPITYIKSISLHNRELTRRELDSTSHYTSADNNFEFYFQSSCLTSPKQVRYKYRLLGFSEEWTAPTTDQKASYSYLPPGAYEFQLLAANNSGLWNSEMVRYKFTVGYPFWRTNWFYFLVIVAFIGVIVLIVRVREKVTRLQKANLKRIIDKQTQTIRDEKDIVQKQNGKITASINYAERIQKAVLPKLDGLTEYFSGYCHLFLPRDIVSGDFYWLESVDDDRVIWAVADCTGHGVPGAFMSMIGNSILNKIIIENKVTDPGTILNRLREGVILALHQDDAEAVNNDGMAITICCFNKKTKEVSYAGSENPLIHIRDGRVERLEVSDQHIGIHLGRERFVEYETKSFQVKSGDSLYMYSDGFIDQVGGPRKKKYFEKPFLDLLLQLESKSIKERETALEEEILSWMKDQKQRDDICILGVTV